MVGPCLPSAVPADGCAFCCVLYGCDGRRGPDYLLLLLVFVRRLILLGTEHPVFILPTEDVPEQFLKALSFAGCCVLPRTEYLEMHPDLLASPEGRHRRVMTKLQALRLTQLRKVILVDCDLLPRQPLDELFLLEPPAAMLMPANLAQAHPLAHGAPVPDAWLEARNEWGAGARVNAGVCLLEPDEALLDAIAHEVSPERELAADRSYGVPDVFGGLWRPSWTPEEDALTRGLRRWRPSRTFTYMSARWNFEVMGDGHFQHLPLAQERLKLDPDGDVACLHFIGSSKPSWYAWHVGHGTYCASSTWQELSEQHQEADPRAVVATATCQWVAAFEEMLAHCRDVWRFDPLQLVGWAAPALCTEPPPPPGVK